MDYVKHLQRVTNKKICETDPKIDPKIDPKTESKTNPENQSGKNLHPLHPVYVTGVPSGQVSHLVPKIPGLQTHRPLI
jgi:hypothetical protein